MTDEQLNCLKRQISECDPLFTKWLYSSRRMNELVRATKDLMDQFVITLRNILVVWQPFLLNDCVCGGQRASRDLHCDCGHYYVKYLPHHAQLFIWSLNSSCSITSLFFINSFFSSSSHRLKRWIIFICKAFLGFKPPYLCKFTLQKCVNSCSLFPWLIFINRSQSLQWIM